MIIPVNARQLAAINKVKIKKVLIGLVPKYVC